MRENEEKYDSRNCSQKRIRTANSWMARRVNLLDSISDNRNYQINTDRYSMATFDLTPINTEGHSEYKFRPTQFQTFNPNSS